MNAAERTEYDEMLASYLDKYPNMPSRTLARLIAQIESDKGNHYEVELLRGSIRHRRGAWGVEKAEARTRSGRKMYSNPSEINEYSIIEEPDLSELEDYVLPLSCTRIGILSDIHIPKHNIGAIDTALTDFAGRNVNTIILNGDVLDNPQFSKFAFRASYTSRTAEWMDTAEMFIENLRHSFPTATILFIEGNHDAWYRRYLWMQAKAFGDDPYYDLESRLGLTDNNVKWIPETQLVRLADYFIFHGHQHCKGGQLDTGAKRLLNRLKSNCIIGHLHFASMFQDVDITGNPCATVHISGALSTLRPSYMPFGGKSRIGYINADVIDGKLQVENVWLRDGRRIVINS